MELETKQVLVVGLGASGQAAARLALARGAAVTICDTRSVEVFTGTFDELRSAGARIAFDCDQVPPGQFDLAVVSPGLDPSVQLYRSLRASGIRIVGELEFGWRLAECPTVAVTGTNGKTTTTELIAHLLKSAGRFAAVGGNIGRPASEIALSEQEAEQLVLEVSSFQLETAEAFRPEIAVLLNLTPDHLDRHGSMADYARAKALIFAVQQADNLAVVQSEAMAYLRSLRVDLPGRLVTFSATSRRADLYFEDGLIMSSLPDWKGPLLSLQQTHLRGPHNAENVMAALAVGRELGLSLEGMVKAMKSFRPGAHRCELVGERNDVLFVNDSKATNLDAMMKAVEATPCVAPDEPNVLLIAGGVGKGLEFHEAGPLLARRVKAAFLIGEAREQMREAWNLFTTCHLADDLEEAVLAAVEQAEMGDVVLLSPACASFDQFTGYAQRGESFKAIIEGLENTTYGGPLRPDPTRDSGMSETTSREHQS